MSITENQVEIIKRRGAFNALRAELEGRKRDLADVFNNTESAGKPNGLKDAILRISGIAEDMLFLFEEMKKLDKSIS